MAFCVINSGDLMNANLYMDFNIFNAAISGDLEFLQQNEDKIGVQKTPTKNTVLHLSSQLGKLEAVKVILSMHPSLLTQANSEGETALHQAAKEGHCEVIKSLIECARKMESGDRMVFQMLRRANYYGDTAVHKAVRYRRLETATILIEEEAEYSYFPNNAGETPLYLAATRGNHEILGLILRKCKSPAYTGPAGKTALHGAVIKDRRDCTEELLQWKPKLVNETDKYGLTPLHYAARLGHAGRASQILSVDESMAYFADNHGNENNTALHMAASQGHISVIKELVSRCPSLWDMVNGNDKNALHIALEHNQVEVIEFILENCPVIGSLLTKKDDSGSTPIDLLATVDLDIPKREEHIIAYMGALKNKNFTTWELIGPTLSQTTLPPQPPQQSVPRNTRSRANTQSQAPLQPPLQPDASQVQESHSTQQHGTSASGSTSTRRGRGVARGLNSWGTGQKLHIDFNNFMQPYGPNEQQFKTHLGIIARNGEQVPLIYEQWKDVPQDILDYIWKEVEDNTDAPPEYRENCLKNVGDIWRKWKSHVKTHFYDIWDTDEDRLNNIPPRVVQNQWETLVAYWGTEKQQMEAAREDTNRINVFTKTRTPKNGGPMNPDTQAVIAEMESRRDAVPEEERTPEFIDGVFTKVVGPDGHGRVRTYGKGVTPQLVFGKGKSTDTYKFNNICEEIRQETRAEFNAKLDEFVRDGDAEMNRKIQEAMIAMRASVRDEILAELRGGPSSIGNVPTSSSVHRPDLDGVDRFSHEDINEGE